MAITRPLGINAASVYDSTGNLVRVADAKVRKVEYSYDDTARPTKKGIMQRQRLPRRTRPSSYGYNAVR